MESHLLQMRGLKHFCLNGEHHRHKSHLLQMRGLKHFCLNGEHHRHKSHLLQMRGLKLLLLLVPLLSLSRIFYRCVD